MALTLVRTFSIPAGVTWRLLPALVEVETIERAEAGMGGDDRVGSRARMRESPFDPAHPRRVNPESDGNLALSEALLEEPSDPLVERAPVRSPSGAAKVTRAAVGAICP